MKEKSYSSCFLSPKKVCSLLAPQLALGGKTTKLLAARYSLFSCGRDETLLPLTASCLVRMKCVIVCKHLSNSTASLAMGEFAAPNERHKVLSCSPLQTQ